MPDDLHDKITQIFKNPAQAAKVVDAIVQGPRPAGWSRKSMAPYYKELYGQEMKESLDTIMANRIDVIYDYETFEKMGMSRNTVYLRVNQSLRYLMERMDPDHKYAKFYRECLQITKERNVGVRISLIPEYRNSQVSEFKPKPVMPKSEAPLWRRKLEAFLESAQPGDKPFIQEHLALTPEEIKALKESFYGVKGFLVNITSFSVKVVRIDEDAL